MQAQMIHVAQLRESGTNPRRRVSPEKDAELLESVRALGVLQPVLARPAGEAFELVFGHRRLRAAVAAGLAEIPASVREMTDLEVLEAQVAENAQREDVHPLEEADAYRALHEQHGRSVEEIAARIGKSRATVYARLKLCDLGEAGRAAFLAGEIEASVALLVARIPPALQTTAIERLAERYAGLDPMSYRQAQQLVQREFMLELARAPWALDDAALLPAAGACTTCPQRSGNQPELFADVCTVDLCTDIDCFRRKRDASWVQRKAQAKGAGVEVVEAKKAVAALFSYGQLSYDGRKRYLDLDRLCGGDPKNKRTFRTLLKKSLDGLPRALARDAEGGIHELVERKSAAKALRALGYDADGAKLRPKVGGEAEETTEARASRVERERANLVRSATAEAADHVLRVLATDFGVLEPGRQSTILRLAASTRVEGEDSDRLRAYATAIGLCAEAEGDQAAQDLILSWIQRADVAALTGLLAYLELAMCRGAMPELAPPLGLDWFRELDAATEAITARAGAAPTKPKRRGQAAVRTCRECGCTDENGCYEGCNWVEQDLCSACAQEGAEQP